MLAVAFFALGVLALSCINCASSNMGRALNVGVVTSGAMDVVSTRQAMAGGGVVEGNPLMPDGAWQQAALKAVAVTVVISGTRWLEREHPALAHVLRAVATTGWSLAAGHNWRVAQSTRQ